MATTRTGTLRGWPWCRGGWEGSDVWRHSSGTEGLGAVEAAVQLGAAEEAMQVSSVNIVHNINIAKHVNLFLNLFLNVFL